MLENSRVFTNVRYEFESKIYTSLLLPLGFLEQRCEEQPFREMSLGKITPTSTMSEPTAAAPAAPQTPPDATSSAPSAELGTPPTQPKPQPPTPVPADPTSAPAPVFNWQKGAQGSGNNKPKNKPQHVGSTGDENSPFRPPPPSNPQGGSADDDPTPGKDSVWWKHSAVTLAVFGAAIMIALVAITLSIVAIRKGPDETVRAEIAEVTRKNSSLEQKFGEMTTKHDNMVTDFSQKLETVKKLAETKPELDIDAILANPAVVAKIEEVVSAKITEARAMIIADASAEAVYTLIGGGFKLNYGGDPVVLMVETTEDGRVNFFITPDTSAPAPTSAEVATEVPTSQ